MKYYFCRFDENENPIVLSFCENRLEEETKNARYLTEEELPIIQARMEEMVAQYQEEELQNTISPEEFLQLLEENF